MERDSLPAASGDDIAELSPARQPWPGPGSERTAPCAGLLLTGGASRRLGADKATAVIGGTRLADRAAQVLAAVCDPVIEVGPGVTSLAACREDPPGDGPFAALLAGAAALGSAAETGVVLLGCDLPGVDRAIVQLLADWPGARTVVPVESGYLQLVCARYGAEALSVASALQVAGPASRNGTRARSLHSLLDAVDFDRITEPVWRAVSPAATFADVDTQGDLERWQEARGR